MTFLHPALFLAALLCATPAVAQLFPSFERSTVPADPPAVVLAPAAPASAYALPDPAMMPGSIDPSVTLSEICNGTTKHRRHVSSATKRAVASAYSVPADDIGVRYEMDHLVPIALGGANSRANLWPQPWPEAERKDRLENEMQRLACVAYRTLTPVDAAAVLAQEQREIAADWPAAYAEVSREVKVQISENTKSWRPFFAWRPVFVGNQLSRDGGHYVWLEWMERRKAGAYEGTFSSVWLYREPGTRVAGVAGAEWSD